MMLTHWKLKLNLKLKKKNKNEDEKKVAKSTPALFFSEKSSNDWMHAKAPLGGLNNYIVRLDSVRPYTFQTAVSVDDLTFEDCTPPRVVNPLEETCDGGEFMCGNGKCISDNLICDFK